MPTLAEIRAKLLEQETKSDRQKTGDGPTFPFWDMQDGETTISRLLPDADKSNPFFWIERLTITLDFTGIKGDATSKPLKITVPCMETWGETCPILTETRPWWKDPELEEVARKYWKKRTSLFQGFVRKSPIIETHVPENPIRRFSFTTQVMKPIKAALMDPDFEDLPIDFENGLDFHIVKTMNGKFADYSTSKWARKTSALTDEELGAIEKYGLFDLKAWLPPKPGEVELSVIKEMFEASVEGKPYDPDRWSKYYGPRNLKSNDESSGEAFSTPAAKVAAPKPAATVSSKPVDDDAPFDADTAPPAKVEKPEPKAAASSKAEDILAMIRSRQKQ